MAERRSAKDGSWSGVRVLETRLGVYCHLMVAHNSGPANASVLHQQGFLACPGSSKRLRIDLDLDSELDIMFLSSIAALLGAKAETVTHISLQYCSHSAWDIFVDHLLAVKPQPTFASLEEFSATPISLGECEFDIEPPPLLGLAVGFCHLNESSPRPFLVAPHITSLALTHVNGPVAPILLWTYSTAFARLPASKPLLSISMSPSLPSLLPTIQSFFFA
ncbi:hypothetical protein MIND_00087300 [Mycena indigotica]|uniref:Uncharacterized protein n=1 Tax=Mycena indigotica TaxID=2126181 RepID=A0A8H6TFG0_9AGAR|nr:uncharacterized protein MIND_00087300 [Mycena indigotica]KAF7315716.1 hypothetical protein MIND_00087300 [Mycena indigotica]